MLDATDCLGLSVSGHARMLEKSRIAPLHSDNRLTLRRCLRTVPDAVGASMREHGRRFEWTLAIQKLNRHAYANGCRLH